VSYGVEKEPGRDGSGFCMPTQVAVAEDGSFWVGLSLPGDVKLVTCATRTRLMGCTHSRGMSDWSHVRPELDLWVALTPGGCQISFMDPTGCVIN
jgi:hypothetical protein